MDRSRTGNLMLLTSKRVGKNDICHCPVGSVRWCTAAWSLYLLWDHILLPQPIAFKIPANLGMVSYTVNAAVRCELTLLLLALTFDC